MVFLMFLVLLVFFGFLMFMVMTIEIVPVIVLDAGMSPDSSTRWRRNANRKAQEKGHKQMMAAQRDVR